MEPRSDPSLARLIRRSRALDAVARRRWLAVLPHLSGEDRARLREILHAATPPDTRTPDAMPPDAKTADARTADASMGDATSANYPDASRPGAARQRGQPRA